MQVCTPRAAFRLLALIGALGLSGVSLEVAGLGALAGVGVIPARSLMAGMSFVPPLYCAALGLLAALWLFGLGWRRRAAFLALLQLLYFGVFGDYSLQSLRRFEDATGKRRFKAIAFNVQYFTEGAVRVAEHLKALEPDVMLLSEAEGGAKTRRVFATAVSPYQVYYARKGDTAIVSRYPLIAFHEVPLPSFQPSLSGFNQTETQYRNLRRTFVHALLDIAGVKVHVLSVRLIAGRGRSHAPLDQWHWGQFLMREQAREVSTFVQYVERLEGPVLFGGDLNATSSSVSIRRLSEIAEDAYLQTHVWGQFTFKTKLLPIQKHKTLPALRLDYLFVRNGLIPHRVDVVPGDVSDHFSVIGEFILPEPTSMAGNHRTLPGALR